MTESCPLCGSELQKDNLNKVDLDSGYAIIGEKFFYVTPTEGKILYALVNAHPRFISTLFILESMYTIEADWPQSKTIEVYLSRIRKKIVGSGYFIQNNFGIGYRIAKGERDEQPPRSDWRNR